MQLSREEAKNRIHEAGMRATAPRVAVLRLLARSQKPLSHSEVLETIGRDDWDQATLYRNLLKLVDADLARIASRVGGIVRYEYCLDGDHGAHAHPHFSCKTCGRLTCLPETRLVGAVDKEWQRSLEGSELQIIGDCPTCLAAERKKKKKARK